MQHDFSIVFDTDNELWQRVLDIFAKNEKYEKKIVKNRNLHHKFPRSFSKALGEEVDNDKDNLISLSLADHFLVHYYYYLLAKKGYRQSMALAFRLMARKGMKYITPETAEAMAKDYEDAVEISKQYAPNKGKTFSDEWRQKISESHKGKTLTAEHRKKIAEHNPLTGKHLPDETRRKLSEANKGHFVSAETRQKIGAKEKGKPLSEQTKAKLSEALKGKNLGKTLSTETRQKMSEARKGRHWKIVDGRRVWF